MLHESICGTLVRAHFVGTHNCPQQLKAVVVLSQTHYSYEFIRSEVPFTRCGYVLQACVGTRKKAHIIFMCPHRLSDWLTLSWQLERHPAFSVIT